MSSSPFLNDIHEQARDAARQFAEKIVAPYVHDSEANEHLPRELFRSLGDAGYLAIRTPEHYGGSDSDLITECLVIEEMSRVCCGVASAMMPQLPAAEKDVPRPRHHRPRLRTGESRQKSD